jgi:hypothetical protein
MPFWSETKISQRIERKKHPQLILIAHTFIVYDSKIFLSPAFVLATAQSFSTRKSISENFYLKINKNGKLKRRKFNFFSWHA